MYSKVIYISLIAIYCFNGIDHHQDGLLPL